jgi:hypothetical protein
MAQLVERMAVNHKVRGSNPRGGGEKFFCCASREIEDIKSNYLECHNGHDILLLDSIVVSISACHADDPGSIPGRGVDFWCLYFVALHSPLLNE